MDLSGFGSILGTMYTDTFDIQRYAETENEDGTTDTTFIQDPVHTGIACRISFSSNDNPETNKEDSNPKYLQVKIFCDPGVDVKKGDKITAKRLDGNKNVLAMYVGTANLPLQFVTHKEFSIVQRGDA